MVKEVEIERKGKVYYVMVDDEDYPVVSRHNWHLLPSKSGLYAYAPIHLGQGDRKMMPMTHFLMGPAYCVDHRDRNTLNNQKHNLRVATKQQNTWNSAKMPIRGGKPTSSKYKGVTKIAKDGLWRATIKKDAKRHYLGSFLAEEEAAIAYNEAAERLHGEWAWLNPVPGTKYARSNDLEGK